MGWFILAMLLGVHTEVLIRTGGVVGSLQYSG